MKKIITAGILAAVLGTSFAGAVDPVHAEAKVNFAGKFDFEAHRGGRDARPENTLYAYAYAIELGATSIECDMQLTADGDIVMSHNPFLNPEFTVDKHGNRIAAGKYDIRKMTVEQIKKFNVADMDKTTEYYRLHGRTQVNPQFAQIPTLEELFQLVQESGNDYIKLNLEAKSYPDPLQKIEHEFNADKVQFLKRFNELVKKYDMADRVILQSFDWEILKLEKAMNPNITLSALIQEEPSWGKAAESLRPFDKEKSPWLGGLDIKDFNGDAIKAAKAIGADIVSIYYGEINKNMVDEAHALGMKVVAWTVNSVSDMEMIYAMGVDGIISDKPWLLRSFLESKGANLCDKYPFASKYHLDTDHIDVAPEKVIDGADSAY